MGKVPIIRSYQDDKEVQEILVKRVTELMDMKKGVLRMDEHASAFKFCFSLVNGSNDRENRRLYRQFLITAPLEEQFSAVLVSEEFMNQSDDDDTEFSEILTRKGIHLGVCMDNGMSPIFGSTGEFIGGGMDNFAARFDTYKQRGCEYSKWRSIYQIKDYSPTVQGTEKISVKLAEFAAMSQVSGLVPIVSIEVAPDGSEDIYKASRVLEKLLINLIKQLNDFDVVLEATILQVSFVQPGHLNKCTVSPEDIADQTLEALKRSLPVALGGLMFHSSGLSEENATQTLNHIIRKQEADHSMLPWKMTYSFGRAQKASAIMTWRDDPKFEEAGRLEIMIRAKANNEALLGQYVAGSAQSPFSDMELFIPNYIF